MNTFDGSVGEPLLNYNATTTAAVAAATVVAAIVVIVAAVVIVVAAAVDRSSDGKIMVIYELG